MFDEQERMNEMWDDYFAKDDAIRERYHAEIQDMRNESLADEHYEYMWKVEQAGFGDNCEAYEAEQARLKEASESL